MGRRINTEMQVEALVETGDTALCVHLTGLLDGSGLDGGDGRGSNFACHLASQLRLKLEEFKGCWSRSASGAAARGQRGAKLPAAKGMTAPPAAPAKKKQVKVCRLGYWYFLFARSRGETPKVRVDSMSYSYLTLWYVEKEQTRTAAME